MWPCYTFHTLEQCQRKSGHVGRGWNRSGFGILLQETFSHPRSLRFRVQNGWCRTRWKRTGEKLSVHDWIFKEFKKYFSFPQIQDFTHSLLATAKLASFHAVSYCMRKEQKADFLIRYPFLNEDPVYRPATRDLFMQAQNSLSKKVHNIFMQQNEVNCLSYYLFGFIKRKIMAKLL